MIDLALKTTLIFALAALVNALLWRASAAQRHSVWMLAFAAVPATALFPGFAPAVLPTIPISVLANATGTGRGPALDTIKYIWCGVTTLLLARLVFSYLWLHYRRQQVSGPVTFGIFHPDILLPSSARDWTKETLASVMLHERAHIRRYDTIAQLFAQIVSALVWFQPLAWYAARRAADERERACDDLVIQQGIPASLYASHLLEIARESSAVPAAAIPMARACSLEHRMRAVLDESTPRAQVTLRYRAALLLLATVLIPGISALKAQSDPVYRVGGDVTAPKILLKVDPDYTEEARSAKLQGTVGLSLVVDKDGGPQQISVTRALGLGLDENAMAAIAQWRFEPGAKDGKPVAVAVQIEINFRLK